MKWLVPFLAVLTVACTPDATSTGSSTSSSAAASLTGTTASGTSTSASTGGTTSAATTHGTTASSASTGTASSSAGSGRTTASGTTSGHSASTASGSGTGTSGTLGGPSDGGYGASCTLNAMTGADSCADAGFQCTADYNGAPTGTCVLPVEFVDCAPTPGPGCAGDAGFPLQCTVLDFELNDGGTFEQGICVEVCSTTDDCADTATQCQEAVPGFPDTGFCYYNFCPMGAPSYSACDAGGANDGQCYPEANGVGATIGLCFQTGAATTDEPCGGTRGGSAPLCGVDNICIHPSLDGGTFCYGLCDSIGTPACNTDAGFGCLPLGLGSTTGLCVDPCQSDMTCPTEQTCNLTDMFCQP